MTRPNPLLRQFKRVRSRLALSLFAGLTTFTIVAQTWWTISQDRQQTLLAETHNGLLAVRLLEEHASQTLQDAVHTLDRVARAVQTNTAAVDAIDIQQIIATYDIGHSRHLKALQYVSPQGTSWISSPDYPTHATVASRNGHIQQLLSNPLDHQVLVGQPYASPYDSQWVIPVARTLYNKADLPVGVVSVDIRLSYFGTLYARVARENQASVTLLANQGFILARSPFEARYVDRDVSDEPRLRTLRSEAVEGSFDDDSFLDDEPGLKLYAYRKLSGFPITTVYARDYASVLAPWQSRTIERSLIAGLTIALVAALTYFLIFSIQRLQRTQRSLLESEAKFLGMFRLSPVPHTLVSLDNGQLVEANDAWLQSFGYRIDEVLGRSADELGIWKDPTQRAELIKHLVQDGEVNGFEVEHLHRDGHTLLGLISARIFTAVGEELILMAMVDIGHQRAIEQEIRDMNQQLEKRVKARTERLEVANHELSMALASVRTMQAELVRSEKLAALGSLVAGVAHELNTPIGNCVTVGSTLQHQVGELSSAFSRGGMRRSTLETFIDSASRGTEILMRALARAGELIGSFKRVAVDQSSDQRRTFEVQTTLREICLTLEPMYKNTGFKFVLDAPPGIMMNSFPGALGQLVANFVSNALQHGFEGREHGNMELRAHAPDADHLVLQFNDDGIGMKPDTLKRVFDPFFTTKLGQGGSGLGIYIVYNIVHDVLGGSIEIHSTLGDGTQIKVTLPMVAPVTGNTQPSDLVA